MKNKKRMTKSFTVDMANTAHIHKHTHIHTICMQTRTSSHRPNPFSTFFFVFWLSFCIYKFFFLTYAISLQANWSVNTEFLTPHPRSIRTLTKFSTLSRYTAPFTPLSPLLHQPPQSYKVDVFSVYFAYSSARMYSSAKNFVFRFSTLLSSNFSCFFHIFLLLFFFFLPDERKCKLL